MLRESLAGDLGMGEKSMSCKSVIITRCLIAVWQKPEASDVPPLSGQMDEVERRFGKPFAFISLAPADMQLPERSALKPMADSTKEIMRRCAKGCSVIEGSGLVATLGRSIQATIFTLSGNAGKVRVVKTLDTAFEDIAAAINTTAAAMRKEAGADSVLRRFLTIDRTAAAVDSGTT
jgi:hypothetical protein